MPLTNELMQIKSTGSYYNFTNIRYAQPPTGNLRFSPPLPPKKGDGKVEDGGASPILCSQAIPGKYSTFIKDNWLRFCSMAADSI